MESINLFENEDLITQDTTDRIVLTSHRIRYKDTSDQFYLTSLSLDMISSIEVRYKSFPIFIILSVISGVGAIFLMGRSQQEAAFILFVATIILAVIYFISRRHTINIASSTASILFQTKGMKKDKVLNFINQVEQARMKLLKK